jgi:exopolyphosphatase/guanosine-5'-triphosphate,3'-diphosphate pyrophosphatase
MRVAAVDLGTNTTRLLVADVEHGLAEEVVQREAITRLGESVDRRRILLPTAIARVRNVLVDYRREAEALGAERVLAVGTSAVRDADNGEAFLGEIEWSYGFATRMLDGGEEAELMLRGVASDRAIGTGTLVVDIGGGSTELVTANGRRIAWAVSTEAGSVRLTERFLRSDPPERHALAACAAHVRSLLPPLDATAVIGVAGTVTSAASSPASIVEIAIQTSLSFVSTPRSVSHREDRCGIQLP